MKLLKYILNVKRSTPNCCVLGETGIYNISYMLRKNVIKYWYRIMSGVDPLLLSVYRNCFGNVKGRFMKHSWCTNVKQLLDNLGFCSMWQEQHTDTLLFVILQVLSDEFFSKMEVCGERN